METLNTTQRLASQCFGLEFLPSKPLVNSETELEHLTAYTRPHLLYALLPIHSPVCQWRCTLVVLTEDAGCYRLQPKQHGIISLAERMFYVKSTLLICTCLFLFYCLKIKMYDVSTRERLGFEQSNNKIRFFEQLGQMYMEKNKPIYQGVK